MILSDSDIRAACESGDIEIGDFDESAVEPASYDMRLGSQALTRLGVIDVAKDRRVVVPRGETVVLYPRETLRLGTALAARFGLTSRHATRGLILLSGPQIDPGYAGVLEIVVFNSGNREVVLAYDKPFVTLEFHRLSSKASRGYGGEFQGRQPLSADIQQLMLTKHKSFAEYEDDVRQLKLQLGFGKWAAILLIAGIIGGAVTAMVRSALESKARASPATPAPAAQTCPTSAPSVSAATSVAPPSSKG